MAGKIYLCLAGCKIGFPGYNNLKGHYGNKHKGEKVPAPEECTVEELPEGYTMSRTAPAPGASTPAADEKSEKETPGADRGAEKEEHKSVYRSMPEPSNILKKILESYPGMKEGVVNEIMSWCEMKGILHPMEVGMLLKGMADVPKGAAEIIPQKYTFALNKAATEGQAEIQMLLSGWGAVPGFGQAGADKMPFGQPGGFGGFGSGMMPFGLNPALGGGFFGGVNKPWWMGPGSPGAEPGVESPADAARNKEIESLKDGQNQLSKSVEALINKMTETEEQKKEAAINARFEKMEAMFAELVQAINANPKGEDATDKAFETLTRELQETKAEIGKMREEAAQAQIKKLEDQLAELSTHLKSQDDARFKKLEDELAEAKAAAAKPVTGRTEMDVISDLATKAIDTVKEAGRDVKTIMLSGQTKERFDPTRGSAKQREAAGEKIVVALEHEASLSDTEKEYLAT